MPAGRMDQRVTFRALDTTPDGMGGTVRGWSVGFKRWGQLVLAAGREAREAGRTQTENMATLAVRRDSLTTTVTTAWSVVIAGEAYNIRSIDATVRRGGMIEMVLQRGVAV
jgi:SPP1 family predicted phage head-tail adaptor